jgi:hypothetical protein
MVIMKKIFLVLMLLEFGFAGDIWSFLWSHKGVDNVTDTVYSDNCKDCHFLYQPGLLPSASWKKLLDEEELTKHFGADASIEEEDRAHILEYLMQNAADKSWYKKSRKINSSIPEGSTELRISKVPYMVLIHKKVDKKYFTSPKVKSASYCDRCHQSAKDGIYEEDDVYIPDHGRWAD